ncbi:MFS transporter [Amycolatopsis pigmentata]|uniref:MFS transporter n=1 Tax=Amycolatopsis pigmentata TaxID=450801 RepID=A0ABW5FQ89_9PSEU
MIGRAPLYLGGMLGPFGAGVVAAMLPELSRSFDVSTTAAATSLTAYLLPFALVMLVSGTFGERWGPSRTIRCAYAGYLVVALAAAVAPWFWLFQVSRGLQGVANAFTTPLLLTKLAATTSKERLGRTLGTYGALQSIGQTSAPLIGGLAAEGSWRWAFAGIAALSAVLVLSPLPPDAPTPSEPARLRDAWQPGVLSAGVVIFVASACMIGLTFLVAFRLDDLFRFAPGIRGLALTACGVAGFVAARPAGAVSDRFGPRVAVRAGMLVGAIAVAVIGVSRSSPVLIAAWALAGVCGQLVLVGTNASVLTGGAGGRGGAISVVTALRFLGMAVAPAAFTGLYRHDPVLGFLVPAVILALTVPLAALSRRTGRAREPTGAGRSG